MIDDRWLRNAEDGTPPSSAAKRALANARDPMRANVPVRWRTTQYGRGQRWRCRWYMPEDGRRSRSPSMLMRRRSVRRWRTMCAVAAIMIRIRRADCSPTSLLNGCTASST
nr:MAG TPA: hypothetical protein [Caudoviricetes sp.]